MKIVPVDVDGRYFVYNMEFDTFVISLVIDRQTMEVIDYDFSRLCD